MCGICGIVDYQGDRIARHERDVLQPVLDALRHRGPDSSGMHLAPPAVLGATRLAILDVSNRAAQPMSHGSDSLVLVFNGEIYNYAELRNELEALGQTFVSNSDTEVVLAMYARLGATCLHRFRGMFAFAVWHSREQKLFLARDRVGEKPLLYYHAGPVFAFASEIPALLQLDWVPRRVDAVGLHLGLYYVHAPAPWTAFRDIRRVPPGTWMELSRDGLKSERYWSCRFAPAEQFQDFESAATAVSRGLDETTALMCRSDVPLGAALSGGLDSGSVVASMSRTLRGFPTFRVSSGPDAKPDEYAASEQIAGRYGAHHHQFFLPSSCVASLDDVVSVFGEPFATPVMLDAQHLAREAKPLATVLLTGTGGDELFGGYPDHWVLRRLDRERSLRCRWQGASAGRLRRDTPARRRPDLASLPLGRVFGTLKFPRLQEFTNRVYGWRMHEAAGQQDPVDLCEEMFLASGAETLVDGFLAQELMLLNQYSLTSILDAFGMQHSLEFRSPFLDVKMIELAMRIPGRCKTGPGRTGVNRKLVLRAAMRDRLPSDALRAGTKTGFGGSIPYREWLHREEPDAFRQRLTSPALRDLGLFDTRALEELWLLSALDPDVPVAWLWGVAMMAAWLECYF